MGRKAGHLALGIGKAAGATLTVIPEEFDRPAADPAGPPGRHPARAPSSSARAMDRDDGDGDSRRGPGRALAPEDLEVFGDARARRARPRAPGRSQPRRRRQVATCATRLEAARAQDGAGVERHRLRAALRRSDPVRHGVHARSGLLRRAVRARWRQRRDGDAGRTGTSSRCRSARCSIPRPAARGCGWWIRTPSSTRLRGATWCGWRKEDFEDAGR